MRAHSVHHPGIRVARGLHALLALAAIIATPVAIADPAVVQLEVRDAETGAFLEAELRVHPDAHVVQDAPPRAIAGRATLPVNNTTGGFLHIAAAGYRSMTTNLPSASALQIWLDPEQPRPFPAAAPHEAVYEGFVHRRSDARPVPGATVRLGSAQARTDGDGRFLLSLAPPPALATEGLRDTLQVTAQYRTATRMLRVVPGSHRLIIDLDAATGEVPDHRHDSGTLQQRLHEPGAPRVSAPALRAPVLAPPATLRIGFADAGFTTPCCTGSCAAVAVLALETYVRRGLNDEWIASWRPDALRAGAIAYRSYGAWHAANPRTTTYDLCSSACCQVNDADTSASTSAAVDATVGLMLERSGIFRSEYSAENNAWDDPGDGLSCSNIDLSCGDGFVGSPAAGWPCLADSVASGRGCFGHGRGMSQWGSQRWADAPGRRWPWIVDHYYNDGGSGSGLRTALISSPLRIDAVAALPAAAAPGARLTLRYTVTSLAGDTHAAVFLGASLYRAGVGYVSDPAHDAGVALTPGSRDVERDFVLPAALAPGTYDLLTALYLDVDGNGAINSGDFPLVTRSEATALTVTPAAEVLFRDGFE